MSIGLKIDLRNQHLNNIRDAIDGGGNSGTIDIYDGDRPDTGEDITDQTLLGTCTFYYPSAPDAVSGELNFNDITGDDNAENDGEASWARVLDYSGEFVMDMSVSDLTGSGDLKMNTVEIGESGPIDIVSAKIMAGNS